MKDLMQDTEFVKIGNDRYMEKDGLGIIYTKKEFEELLKQNDKEVRKEADKKIENDTKSKAK